MFNMMRLASSLRFANRVVSKPARHVAVSQRFGAPVWCRGVASAGSSPTTFLPKDVVQDRILEVIRNFPKIDASKVNASVHFQNDLAIDSLDQVELVMAFEDEFNIEITDEEAEKINTVEDAIRYIAAHPMAK